MAYGEIVADATEDIREHVRSDYSLYNPERTVNDLERVFL